MGAKNKVRVTATVAGRPLGEFRTGSGFVFTMADRKSINGAGQRGRARKGRLTTENVTLSREDDGFVDLDWLVDQRGKAASVSRQPLDDDNNPRGRARTFTGVLKRVTLGDSDAADDSDDDMFELEILCDDV